MKSHGLCANKVKDMLMGTHSNKMTQPDNFHPLILESVNLSTSNNKVSSTGNTQSELNFAAANPLNSGMIESSTSETRYVSSDFELFLDLDIEPTQCTSSDVLIASPMISSTSSASGLVTVTPALGNTSLHSDTLESLSTAKHNDLISSTASTLGTYSGTVSSVTSAPLGNVDSGDEFVTHAYRKKRKVSQNDKGLKPLADLSL